MKETCIPREDRIEVRSFNTGRVNNSAMVRIELIGNDKVVPLWKWYPEEAARKPIAELRAWLQ